MPGKNRTKPSGIITLLTDFGNQSAYPAAVKGIILKSNPEAKIIDISHDLKPWDIRGASYVLWNSYKFFPAGTVHLVVVDPGVGSNREGIIVRAGDNFFVGPNNGVLSFPLMDLSLKRVIKIDERGRYISEDISRTFHGRDVFAPVAGALSRGVEIEAFGAPLPAGMLKRINFPKVKSKGNIISGEVIFIDHFGNLITNIPQGMIGTEKIVVRLKGAKITGLKKTYSDVKKGRILALINSSSLLEISINRGDAARHLNCRLGERVSVYGA